MTYFWVMKIFRTVFFRKLMAVSTGLLVLNMSLFLAEAEALKMLKDREMKVNIYRLLSNAANEEEKDFAGGSEEELVKCKETDLFTMNLTELIDHIASKDSQLHCWESFDTKSPFRETLSPPPKA